MTTVHLRLSLLPDGIQDKYVRTTKEEYPKIYTSLSFSKNILGYASFYEHNSKGLSDTVDCLWPIEHSEPDSMTIGDMDSFTLLQLQKLKSKPYSEVICKVL